MSWCGWETTHPAFALVQHLAAARERVVTHPLYDSLDTHSAIATFMEHHVFAVWDFMSLLKSLQRELTCITVPWVPTGSTDSRRLINEIVLAEESDELAGGYVSHFEWYVAAMAQAGADHSVVDKFIDLIRAGEPVPNALVSAGAPRPSAEFVSATWRSVWSAPVHCQAAAFAFGREGLIPDMFTRVVAVNKEQGGLQKFRDYVERHIEVDGEEHTPMAVQMLVDLCGDEKTKWRDCMNTVEAALDARSRLWDGILAAISADREMVGSLTPSPLPGRGDRVDGTRAPGISRNPSRAAG
jgi:hypothetical protein